MKDLTDWGAPNLATLPSRKVTDIQAMLDQIEQRHKVTVFLAVESGSRAWGFPSADSDYDVRFLYLHNLDWYVTAFRKKDQIDLMINQDLDAAGWDLAKCMRLLYKSNSALIEWLNSPVVYRQDEHKVTQLRDLAIRVFQPQAVFYHYLSLAKRKLLHPDTRTHEKSFLYALRALLCARWVEEFRSAPPVEFKPLVERYLNSSADLEALLALLTRKLEGQEVDRKPIPENLWSLAQRTFETLNSANIRSKPVGDIELYDQTLRNVLFGR